MENSEKSQPSISRFFRHRQHPVKLLGYTSRNLWLLLIPLSKYLIASKFDFQSWIKTNWVDILAITGIFAIAILRWVFIRFDVESDGLVAHTGLFGMVRTKVFFSELTTVSICQSWYTRAVKAYTVYFETNAKTISSEDVRLLMSKKNAELIYSFLTVRPDSEKKGCAEFSPKKSYLLVFSLLFSSTLSGVILFGTFMFEAYKIVGLEMEQKVINDLNGRLTTLDENFLKLSQTIPKAVLILAGIIIVSRLISVIATLIRHWSFTVLRSGSQFLVKSGVLTKRRHIINRSMVNYYDLTQTFLMKLFRICSVTLDCTGYGKSRREISALIPITTYTEVNASLRLLVPDLPRPRPEVKTTRSDVRRFIFLPLVFCCIPPAALHFLKPVFPDRASEMSAIMAVLLIPLIWLVVVKTAAAFNTSVGFSKDGCTLNYCRMYIFHKVFLPKRSISKIRITRNPFQMINKTCTLWIYTNGEKTRHHKMKFMPYEETRNLCLREGYIMFE